MSFFITVSEEASEEEDEEGEGPPLSITITGGTRRRRIRLPQSPKPRKRTGNEDKRILRLTKKEVEDHFSLIDKIETADEGRYGSSLLGCYSQGGRMRRRPSFPRSPQSWSRTQQREHGRSLPFLINKYSSSGTTQIEEADHPPQLTGSRRKMGNEKMTLLP